jgi:predicted ATPase
VHGLPTGLRQVLLRRIEALAPAARRNAYHEGVAYLRKGLTLLTTLPASAERTRDELTLLLILGALLMAARGTAAPEAGEVYTRAHALCQQIEAPLQRCQVLWGLIQFSIVHAQLRILGEMGQQLLHLGQAQGDPTMVLEAYIALEMGAFHRGDLVTTRAYMEHSLPLCHTWPAPTLSVYSGYEPRIFHAVWFTWVLWALGYAEQSQQRCQEMLALAQQVGHTASLGLAQMAATILVQYRRDAAATSASANALMAFGAMQGIPLRGEQGRILRGWALAMQGDAATGVVQIHQGLTATDALGFKLLRPYFLTLLAEAYGQAGQPEAGLTVVDEAVTLIATAEERWWEPEVYRLQGELLLQLPHPDMPQVVACFHQALTVARAQQAKVLELRAAMSLSRLWQQQGQHDVARQLLAPIYAWFTEGFDTVDLQEARALLEA